MSTPTRTDVQQLMPALKKELADRVGIPSISALGYPAETRPALLQAYEAVSRLFADAGVTILDPLELPDTAPVLMGEIPAPEGAPTVLDLVPHLSPLLLIRVNPEHVQNRRPPLSPWCLCVSGYCA